ncbi:MAG: cytochrome c family protein [Nitrospirae bacterium]|nr:cytochrome c family protein [Nitrospirota bacterium]
MKQYTVKMLFSAACATLVAAGMIATMTVSPARVEGKEMPGTIVIKKLKSQYGAVTFNHEMHASIAGNCGTCHHQHNDKMRATCTECHALSAGAFKSSVKQGFAACSSCHSDYSPEMPEMPGLKVALHKKCFQCHVGIGDLGSSPGACVKTCHAKT